MPDRMEYQISLQKDGRFDTYESGSVFAASDVMPCRKPKTGLIHSVQPTKTLGCS